MNLLYICENFLILLFKGLGCWLFFELLFPWWWCFFGWFVFFVFSRIQSKHLCPNSQGLSVLKFWRTEPKCIPVWWIYTIHLPAAGWERMRSCCHVIGIPSSIRVFTMKRHYFKKNTCRQNSPLALNFLIKLNIGKD